MFRKKDTVKIWIEANEWYPVHEIFTEMGVGADVCYDDYSVTIPKKQLDYFRKVFAEFDSVQKILKGLVDKMNEKQEGDDA